MNLMTLSIIKQTRSEAYLEALIKKVISPTSMAVKLITFAALLEYAFLKPYILADDPEESQSTDFIGYCLVMAMFAIFGEISLKGLPDQGRKAVLLNGLLGGVLGHAWLLVHLKQGDRRMHHLLVANGMALAGVLCGAWNERRKKIRTRWN